MSSYRDSLLSQKDTLLADETPKDSGLRSAQLPHEILPGLLYLGNMWQVRSGGCSRGEGVGEGRQDRGLVVLQHLDF